MISFLSILAMGFFLGMRHATDPDHVIAVTTIVSNQRNNLRAVLIGAFWGAQQPDHLKTISKNLTNFKNLKSVRVSSSREMGTLPPHSAAGSD